MTVYILQPTAHVGIFYTWWGDFPADSYYWSRARLVFDSGDICTEQSKPGAVSRIAIHDASVPIAEMHWSPQSTV